MLARSMARVMGAWLGPRVDTGEIHTIASASLLTNWHSPSLTVTVTLLPASRELPEMVSRVPPDAGPRLGLTRSNAGVTKL